MRLFLGGFLVSSLVSEPNGAQPKFAKPKEI